MYKHTHRPAGPLLGQLALTIEFLDSTQLSKQNLNSSRAGFLKAAIVFQQESFASRENPAAWQAHAHTVFFFTQDLGHSREFSPNARDFHASHLALFHIFFTGEGVPDAIFSRENGWQHCFTGQRISNTFTRARVALIHASSRPTHMIFT